MMTAKTENSAQLGQIQSLALWNITQRDYPLDACIPQLVAIQAATTPDAVALVSGEQTLSYGELNKQANQLAHYLQTLGVREGTLVGLCVERSLDMVVGLGCVSFFCTKEEGGRIQEKSVGERGKSMKAKKNKRERSPEMRTA